METDVGHSLLRIAASGAPVFGREGAAHCAITPVLAAIRKKINRKLIFAVAAGSPQRVRASRMRAQER
ncbi:hypothetical protein, partial [Mesorhizobium sp. M1A.F.Ca.ET.072.01.1.1]